MDSEIQQPLVSMVIPSFNHERYGQACIASIIAQDYKNIELIIIDDGSTDDSVRKIESMVPACAARFARFEFRSRPNKGLAASLNEALEWSRGTYFAAIASDDILLPNKTSSLLAHIIQEENVAGIFGGCELINDTGSVFDRISPLPAYYAFSDVIRKKYVIATPSQLLRLNLVKEVGCYPVGLHIEDWYMWLALTKAGYRLKVVPDILVQYRQHESNISKNAQKMLESRKWILNCFKNHALYKFAMADIHVFATIDFSCVSKKRSAAYLLDAIRYSPKIILTHRFINGFFRLFVPCFIVKRLVCVKFWLRKNMATPRRSL